MHISKMHGTGNDFILGDWSRRDLSPILGTVPNYPGMAKVLCDRHFGIGADGLILVLSSTKADFKMRIFNPDGSEAEMCGNGIRCFARHVVEKKITPKTKFTVETLAGIMEPECLMEGGSVKSVRVNMGIPRYGDLDPKKGDGLTLDSPGLLKMISIENNGKSFSGATVSMGNPHFVIFTETASAKSQCHAYGAVLSQHPQHPHGSNVEFVELAGLDALRVYVWERGAGPTLACGSGACAAVAAARILKKLPEKVHVEMPGGPLLVTWDGHGPIYLTGPAAYVFEGEVSDEVLAGRMTAHEKFSRSK